MTWAMTMANLCSARKILAEQLGDVDLVRRVLADYATVADVFRAASHARYYELLTEQVALTRKLEQKLLGQEPPQGHQASPCVILNPSECSPVPLPRSLTQRDREHGPSVGVMAGAQAWSSCLCPTMAAGVGRMSRAGRFNRRHWV